MSISNVRVGFRLSSFDIRTLDPANINTVHEGLLLTNLYSGLVEYDRNGNLQAGIAEKFYWDGDKLIFEFGDKVVANSGHRIDANDAAISIKRVLKLGSSTHTNINRLLCNSDELISVLDECESVKVIDGRLVIRSKDPQFNSFLLQTLAAGDLAIVPASAIDIQTLKIKNLSETSGSYFIERRAENHWVLRANPRHFLLGKDSPKRVDLIEVPGNKSISQMLIDNEIDLITTTNNLDLSQFEKVTATVPDVTVSKTSPIKLFALQFSLPSLRKTTSMQRLALGKRYKKLTLEKYPLPLFWESTEQFFLQDAFGQLTSDQVRTLSQRLEDAEHESKIDQPLSFYWYNSLKEPLSIYRGLTELKMVPTDRTPFHEALEKRMDLALVATDVAFEEDVALLGYNFHQGTFGFDDMAARNWMDRYQEERSKEKRAEMLRELHFKALLDGVIIPLVKAPYLAIGRNGFAVDLSPLFATTYFANIKRQ